MSGGPFTVVATGVGLVSAFGCGTEGLEAALAEGATLLQEVERPAGYHRDAPDSARRALLAGSVSLAEWLKPAEARRMSPPSKFAVAAARQALARAGLGPESGLAQEPATAVVISTAFGPSSYTERLLEQVFREGPEAASPFLFTECVANAPAAQIAIVTGARGANLTVVQREAGPLAAFARGAAEIASGRARRALVGAVEEITPLVHSLLDRFGAISRGGASGRAEDEAARPFDRDRDGFLASEGAAVIVLEREEDALARGARPLAKITAWSNAFDPTATATEWGTGAEGLARRLGKLLDRSGGVSSIDRIVSGASGSRRGDALEARTLRQVWSRSGLPLPPLLAPKAVAGEYAGCFLAAMLLAAEGLAFGPTAGFREADPELGVIPYDGRALPRPRRLLATSLAAGGAACWVVLDAAPVAQQGETKSEGPTE